MGRNFIEIFRIGRDSSKRRPDLGFIDDKVKTLFLIVLSSQSEKEKIIKKIKIK